MEKLPSDIINEIIYYIMPKDRPNYGIINKYLKYNKNKWMKKIRISTPNKIVYYRLKFLVHLSKIETYTPNNFKSKTKKKFNNLKMIKIFEKYSFLRVYKKTIYYIVLILGICLNICLFLEKQFIFTICTIGFTLIGSGIIDIYIDRSIQVVENYELTKQEIINAYVARDYYYRTNESFNQLVESRINNSGLYRNILARNIPNFETKIKELKRSKNIFKFYDLFTISQLNTMGW